MEAKEKERAAKQEAKRLKQQKLEEEALAELLRE